MRLLNRKRERRIANAVIADPELHTTMDAQGAVRSVQAANVDLPAAELEAMWAPINLERLARTYWWYLSRISLGLIRVHYGDTERAVVFLTRPFVLLRFDPPDYDISADRGIVRWQIRDGLLVARPHDGHLEIDVQRTRSDHPGYERVHVEVEVANFYPALAKPFRWFYVNTQSRIHVIVTHGFLKYIARLELEESAIGRFAVPQPAGANGGRPQRHEDVTVGSTPWGVVTGIAAAFAAIGFVVALAWRGDLDRRRRRRRP